MGRCRVSGDVAAFFLTVRCADTEMGIWDGDEFVFLESAWFPVSILKLLWRYGMAIFKAKVCCLFL